MSVRRVALAIALMSFDALGDAPIHGRPSVAGGQVAVRTAADWFNRPEFPSNSLVGAVGAAAGPDGAVWTVVRGPDDRVHRQKL
jgi:hypothetical protein